MKALLAILAMAASAHAQSTAVIYRPPPTTVISPLTSPTAQSNQQLLSQINSTISQRYFQHQVLTLAQPAPVPIFQSSIPRVILNK